MRIQSLDYWIASEHLTDESLTRYAGLFTEDPHQTLWIDGFLRAERLAELRSVFATDGVFKESHGLYANEAGGREEVSSEAWHAAAPERRFERELLFEGARPDARMSVGSITLGLFYNLLHSQGLLEYMGRVSGRQPSGVEGIQTRITRLGDLLGRHTDFINQRCLCSVFYVSDGWQSTFGGRLQQYHRHHPARTLEPLANRLVVFRPNTQASHAVEPLSAAAADWQRWAITTWFMARDI